MTSSIDNLTAIAADLNAAGKTVKVTVLKPRKACLLYTSDAADE